MLLMMGLVVGGLIGVRHDLMPSSGTIYAWHLCLGSRRPQRIVSAVLFLQGQFWNGHRTRHIDILCSGPRVFLFLYSRVVLLVLYRYCLTQLPIRSHGLKVIPAKVHAGSDTHGRQCLSSRLSLTLAIGTDITHAILGSTYLPSIMVFTYCRGDNEE